MFEFFNTSYLTEMPPTGALHLGIALGALFSETVKKTVRTYQNRQSNTSASGAASTENK